jgi:hypothetical protein
MLSSFDELLPGDAVDAPGHHVVLFAGWNDQGHSGMCVIEQESTALGMQFHVRDTASMQSEYKPMRALSLGNDPGTPTAAATPSDPGAFGGFGDPTTGTPTTGTPTSVGQPLPPTGFQQPTFDPNAPNGFDPTGGSFGGCNSNPASLNALCASAGCGMVQDGCGGVIDCGSCGGF